DPAAAPQGLLKAGEQLPGFGLLRDDGPTACGCWSYAGAWPEAGNQMAPRDNAAPWRIGQALTRASWRPATRPLPHHAASRAPDGPPWDPTRRLVQWNGNQWSGADVPDIQPNADPGNPERVQPFIMNAEGVIRLYAPTGLAEGPLPEHYEPFESPLAGNLLHGNAKARANPAARVFKGDMEAFGTADEFPYVATSYR